MKWSDDLFLEHSPHERGTLQLALYSMHLASGSTLNCRNIKSATLKKYIATVNKVLTMGKP